MPGVRREYWTGLKDRDSPMRLTTLALAGLMTAPVAFAEDSPTKRLNAVLGKITSMQATFTQYTLDPDGKPLQTLKGTMSVKRPGNFRWDTQEPFTQEIVANNEVVWVYDPELQQATKQQLDKQVGNTPALLLSGDTLKMSASFTIADDKTAPKNLKAFLLRPKSKDALFDVMRLAFKGPQLVSMQMKDSLGQKTDITFSDIRLNGKIADSVFQFTPPKGVDVINEL